MKNAFLTMPLCCYQETSSDYFRFPTKLHNMYLMIPVLCESQQRVRRLLEKANGYGFEIPMPITIEEIDERVNEVYIDDVKRVLDLALKINLAGITVNQDEECEVSEL